MDFFTSNNRRYKEANSILDIFNTSNSNSEKSRRVRQVSYKNSNKKVSENAAQKIENLANSKRYKYYDNDS
jgi:hypothetical protein